jgi:6-phosphogluconolactonase
MVDLTLLADQRLIVYVANSASADIHVLRVGAPDCTVELVEVVPFSHVIQPGKSTPMALSPDRSRLYAGTRGDPLSVISFEICAATGRLASRGVTPLMQSMAYIRPDRSGRFLLSASYGEHTLGVNAIDADGVVGPTIQSLTGRAHPHAILTDRDNRHAFATSLGGDVVYQFKFDALTGALSPNDPPVVAFAAQTGPRHLEFHPDGKWLYLLGELDATLTVFDYDAETGRLQQKQINAAIATGLSGRPSAADLHVTPDGRFLYASERTSSTLSAFRIDPLDGTLTHVARVPTESSPRGFTIDPTGQYLFSVGQLSNSLTAYAIDRDEGTLREVCRFAVGGSPDWVESIVLP